MQINFRNITMSRLGMRKTVQTAVENKDLPKDALESFERVEGNDLNSFLRNARCQSKKTIQDGRFESAKGNVKAVFGALLSIGLGAAALCATGPVALGLGVLGLCAGAGAGLGLLEAMDGQEQVRRGQLLDSVSDTVEKGAAQLGEGHGYEVSAGCFTATTTAGQCRHNPKTLIMH